MAREVFSAGKKLALRWRGQRRFIKPLSDYVQQVEGLRYGNLEEVCENSFKLYADHLLCTRAIISHVMSSEMGTPVSRLIKLVENDRNLMVQIRWNGLLNSENTLEPLHQVFEDLPQTLRGQLERTTMPTDLVRHASRALSVGRAERNPPHTVARYVAL